MRFIKASVIRNPQEPLASPFSEPQTPMSSQEAETSFCHVPYRMDSETVQLREKNNSWNSGWDWRLLLLWGMTEGENELNMSTRQIWKAEHFQSQTKQTLQLGEMSLYLNHTQYMNWSPLLMPLLVFFLHMMSHLKTLHCCWVGLLWKQTLAEIWTASPNVSLTSLLSLPWIFSRTVVMNH